MKESHHFLGGDNSKLTAIISHWKISLLQIHIDNFKKSSFPELPGEFQPNLA